jgi:hypothetical protein
MLRDASAAAGAPSHHTLPLHVVGSGSAGCVVRVGPSICPAAAPLGPSAGIKLIIAHKELELELKAQRAFREFQRQLDPTFQFTVATATCGPSADIASLKESIEPAAAACKLENEKWAMGYDADAFARAVNKTGGLSLMDVSSGAPTATYEKVTLRDVLVASASLFMGAQIMSDAQFVHGDLKPANIIITTAVPRALKFIDFGSARHYYQLFRAMPLRDRAYAYDPPEYIYFRDDYKEIAGFEPAPAVYLDSTIEFAARLYDKFLTFKSDAAFKAKIIYFLISDLNYVSDSVSGLTEALKALDALEALEASALRPKKVPRIMQAINDTLLRKGEVTAYNIGVVVHRTSMQMVRGGKFNVETNAKGWSRNQCLVKSIPITTLALNTYGIGISLAEMACEKLNAFASTKALDSASQTDFLKLIRIFGKMMHCDPMKRIPLRDARREVNKLLASCTSELFTDAS